MLYGTRMTRPSLFLDTRNASAVGRKGRQGQWLLEIGLLVVFLLAGCATTQQTQPDANPTPSSSGASTSLPGPISTNAPPPVAIAIDSALTSPGVVFPGQAVCATNGCDTSLMLMMSVAGSLAGHVVEYGHEHVATDGSRTLRGTLTFTGTVSGCGAGVLTFVYTGHADAPAAAQGGKVALTSNVALLPGSSTLGMAGVSNATLLETMLLNPDDHAGTGTLKGTILCKPALVPMLPPRRDGGREVHADALFDTDGAAAGDWYSCTPTNPKPCSFDAHQYWAVHGQWNGIVDDHPYSIDVALDGSLDADIERVFTGSIAGCGSGTVTFVGHGHVGNLPSTTNPGTFRGHEEWMIAPGSTTTGFAGLAAANVTADYDLTYAPYEGYARGGAMSGKLWCQPPATMPDRKTATAIHIKGRLDAAGSSWPEQTVCDPLQPGVCEITWTQLLDFSGGQINGIGIDHYHFHFEQDGSINATVRRVFMGSIEGCGSGVFTMGYGPANIPQPPDMTHPGSFITVEKPMRLVPGATTRGFASLADTELVLSYSLDYTQGGSATDGVYEGTIWC